MFYAKNAARNEWMDEQHSLLPIVIHNPLYIWGSDFATDSVSWGLEDFQTLNHSLFSHPSKWTESAKWTDLLKTDLYANL